MFGRKRREAPIVEVKKVNAIMFIAYLVLGIYFLNIKFSFFKVPEKILQFNEWIIVAGGVFLLLGAIHYYKSKR